MDSSSLAIGLLNWTRRAHKALGDIKGTEADAPALAQLQHALEGAFELGRAAAPEMWQVEADLASMMIGQPAACRLPREFSAIPEMAQGVGFPLTLGGGGGMALNGEAIELQTLRDAMIKLGAAKLPPVLYHGPYRESGHHLHGPGGAGTTAELVGRMGFPLDPKNFYNHIAVSRSLDGAYCPGRITDRRGREVRTRLETEGEAKLTHENGMTILAIWDRSVDERGGCNSVYVALGVYDFDTMKMLCKRVYEWRWSLLESRVSIVLVEKERIS